jgi:uncharacterized protein YcbX
MLHPRAGRSCDVDSTEPPAPQLIDTDAADGYPELDWIGRRLRVGDAVFEISMGCPRCVMTTRPTPELPEDHRIMRTLVRETRPAGAAVRIPSSYAILH